MRLIVVVCLILVDIRGFVIATNKPVTNEDIRDAILSVVHMLRSTEDKLERHEYRERALGDQIKKALTTIDKRQKLLDPVKGTLSRLDERLAAVETILMQKDERERIQLEKTNELVEQLQQNLPKMLEKLKSDIALAPKDDSKSLLNNTSSKTDLENFRKEIESKIDHSFNNVLKNMEQIRDDNKNNVQLIKSTSKNVEDFKQQINNCQKDKSDLQSNVLQELQKQKTNVEQILTNIKTISGKVPKVAEATDIQAAKAETLKALEQNSAKLQKVVESLDAARTKNDLQPKILQTLEQQKASTEHILSNVKNVTSRIPERIAQPADVHAIQNEILKSLEQLKDVSHRLSQIDSKVENVRRVADESSTKLQKSIESTDMKSKTDLQPRILQALEQQKGSTEQILSNVKNLTSKIPDRIAQAADVHANQNEILKSLEQLKDVSHRLSQIDSKIENVRRVADESSTKLQKSIESTDMKSKTDLQPRILQALEQLKGNIDQILINVKTITSKVPDKIAQVSDIQAVVKPFEQIKKDLAQQATAITDARKSTEQSNLKLQKAVENIDAKTPLKILQVVEQQKSNIDQIVSNVKVIITKIPNKILEISDIQALFKSLEEMKKELFAVEKKIADSHRISEQQNEKLQKTVDAVESSTKNNLQPNILDEIKNELFAMENKIADSHRISEQRNEKLQKTVDAVESSTKNNLQPNILQALERQSANVDQIISVIKKVPNRIADAADVQDAKSEMEKSLEQIKNSIVARTSHLENQLADIQRKANENDADLRKTITDLEERKLQNDIQPALLKAMESQRMNIDHMLRNIQMVTDIIPNVAKVEDVDRVTNQTQKVVSEINNECISNYHLMNKQLQDLHSIAEQSSANVYKTFESITQTNVNLQPMILQAVETQNTTLAQILSNTQRIPSSNPEAGKNETLQSLQQVKDEVLGQGVLLINKISALHALSEKNNENLQKTIVESGEVAEQLNANVASSFEKLSDSVRSLSKLEQIMVQTADSVLDTKRRVEYGVHQISLDVGTVIKKNSKELNSTINARFDNLEHALLEPEKGALSNLTSKLADEIDQVWRQISIMHEQMGANTDTLERIQTQTDSYINGSAMTMDNMRGKVVQITSSMAEVDDNLNYLLGRLSLVTQEFNRIKSGLGEALDQIKSSFNIVQQKLRENGPGPHPIESSEVQPLIDNSPKPVNTNSSAAA